MAYSGLSFVGDPGYKAWWTTTASQETSRGGDIWAHRGNNTRLRLAPSLTVLLSSLSQTHVPLSQKNLFFLTALSFSFLLFPLKFSLSGSPSPQPLSPSTLSHPSLHSSLVLSAHLSQFSLLPTPPVFCSLVSFFSTFSSFLSTAVNCQNSPLAAAVSLSFYIQLASPNTLHAMAANHLHLSLLP